MTLREDDRAVTVHVGAVLLFGFLVVAMSMHQATVVPSENEAVEFRHGERVRADLLSLHSALDAAATGDPRSAQIELGTEYPRRTFFVNPPPVTGSLRSADAGTVTVGNAVAVGDAETADHWNGDSRRFETDRLTYRAGYNVRANAPTTVVEHGVVADVFESGAELPRTEQTLVRGRTIDLVALDAGVSESRTGVYSVTPTAVSPATRTVAIRNETHPVVVEFNSALALDTWRELLANQTVAEGGHVQAITETADGDVRLELEAGIVYRLRMAKVAVGTAADTSAEYLTTVDGSTVRVATAGDDVVVEARDRFNNPAEGAMVEVVQGAGLVTETNASTDADGRATFSYDGDDEGTLRLRLAGGTTAHETVEIAVRRSVAGDADPTGRLVGVDSSRAFDANGDGTAGGFDFVLRNTHVSEVTVTKVRVVPDHRDVTGLRDSNSAEGERRSELHIEALGNGTSGTVDVPTRSGLDHDEFLYISDRGSVLSMTQNRTERIYDTDWDSYDRVEANQSGTPTIPSGERARLSFTEFYVLSDALTGGYSGVDAADIDFTVAVSYEVGGVEMTDTFVVRPQ